MRLIHKSTERRSPSRRVAQCRQNHAGSETGAPMVRIGDKFCRSGCQSAPYSTGMFEPTHVGGYEVIKTLAHLAPINADWLQPN